MARRRIGQEQLALGRDQRRGTSPLDEVAALVDWAELDGLLSGISAAAKGEPGWPPLALFRALLLATWHDLSDVRLAEALDDRASFRRFCGFAAHEPTPERTAFVRFRAELLRRGLDRGPVREHHPSARSARRCGAHRHAGGRHPDPVRQRPPGWRGTLGGSSPAQARARL